jgi:hypothetical protein
LVQRHRKIGEAIFVGMKLLELVQSTDGRGDLMAFIM